MMNDPRPACPRCATRPRGDCPECEELPNRFRSMPAMLIVITGTTPPRVGRYRSGALPFIVAGLLTGLLVSIAAGKLGASPVLQFSLNLGSAVVGMLLAALIADHLTARRRLWRRPPPPPDCVPPARQPTDG